ncbi:GntR family transcriptional regulator [Paenibacillus sacheonensis]|uniref:Substrate-binding domain-containing protein n=1 Tax=Paenibacillus sacheonensis TaxID=742054 RepID=A0A7X4YSZ6_9BACL|nr:GntR family transcriptional regulator [Paenibacillus sacheonensis]MBM7567736.1 LacI family transcriptional regulator [Paenibacillus sacheonensis]NBC71990.1 substrate-binding domain-containing protein [Paenibacillus sacheonensis]
MKDTMPLYKSIVEDIKSKIHNGELKEGDSIPTQIELARLYDTSEITSRRALSELAGEGLVVRIRGKGTFIQLRDALPDQEKDEQVKLKQILLVHPSAPPHLFNHPFYSNFITGIHAVCEENGIEFQLFDIADNVELEVNDSVGAIVLPGVEQENGVTIARLKAWKEAGLRMVLAHFYFPQLQIPYVIVDNLTGGYLATEHLISLGHKRIGIIVTGRSLFDINQEFMLRLQGYKLALSQHGIPFDESLVTVMEALEELEEMGYNGAMQLLALAQPPTAIFATSDYKAFGAMRAGKERGLSIPADLSIVGYDDVVQSRYSSPALTTVHQNTERMGRRAVELLLRPWSEREIEEHFVKEEIVPKLLVRKSTAAVNVRA